MESKHTQLVAWVRVQLEHVKRKGVHIQWDYVPSHTGVWGIEKADELAKLGARGNSCLFEDPVQAKSSELLAHSRQPPWRRRAVKSGGPWPRPPWEDGQGTPWFLLGHQAEPELPALDWEGLAQVHSDEDLDTLHQLRADLNAMWEQIRQSTDEQVTQDLKRQHKLLNRSIQCFRVQARGRFVRSICKEAEEHMQFHDLGKFYQSLKKLGVHLDGHTLEGKVTHGLADVRKHCKSMGSNLVPVAESMLDSVPLAWSHPHRQ